MTRSRLVLRSVAIVLFFGCTTFFLARSFPTAQAVPPAQAAPAQATISPFFSPRGGCTDEIVKQITNAKQSIRVQAYRITSVPIVEAIVAAQKRGVSVEIIIDKVQQSKKYSDATFFANHDMPVLIDKKHAIAHNKIIIIDNAILITGSFNFSKGAEEDNAENMLVISGMPELVTSYIENFDKHKEHSEPYVRPEGVFKP